MHRHEWLANGVPEPVLEPSEQENSDSDEDGMPPLGYWCRRPEAGHAAPTGSVTAEGNDYHPAAPALMLSEATDPTARPEPRTRRRYDHEADSSDDDRNPEKRARASASSSSFQ
jgi:hypothetical protein